MFNLFKPKKKFPVRTIDQLKNSVEILFIDNEVFNLTEDLKENSYWLGSIDEYGRLIFAPHFAKRSARPAPRKLVFTDKD